MVHRQRWWIKALVWDEDHRDLYWGDQFLGDVRCDGSGYGHYGNPDFRDPYFAELRVPEVVRLEQRLSELCPEWPWFRSAIQDSWLCGPKAFRFLERVLWGIGKRKPAVSLPSHPLPDGDRVPGFLQCEDTYVSSAAAREWVGAFARGLRQWLAAQGPSGEVAVDAHQRLGDRAAAKLWLVGLYLRKLEFLNPYGGMEPPTGPARV